MESKQCLMTLKSYVINKINYAMNEDFDFTKQQVINIQPLFKRDIIKIDKDNVSVMLSILIEKKDVSIPFELEISITGTFNVENWESSEDTISLVKNNTVSILFPFLRTLVANTTGSGMLPPYIIPIMNITSIF